MSYEADMNRLGVGCGEEVDEPLCKCGNEAHFDGVSGEWICDICADEGEEKAKDREGFETRWGRICGRRMF